MWANRGIEYDLLAELRFQNTKDEEDRELRIGHLLKYLILSHGIIILSTPSYEAELWFANWILAMAGRDSQDGGPRSSGNFFQKKKKKSIF